MHRFVKDKVQSLHALTGYAMLVQPNQRYATNVVTRPNLTKVSLTQFLVHFECFSFYLPLVPMGQTDSGWLVDSRTWVGQSLGETITISAIMIHQFLFMMKENCLYMHTQILQLTCSVLKTALAAMKNPCPVSNFLIR